MQRQMMRQSGVHDAAFSHVSKELPSGAGGNQTMSSAKHDDLHEMLCARPHECK
uniref:Uncharacterized protein n=1 Tax=Peronospora matthiolae TaxID=2874970 RepID=A0AAV1UP11_9STRA